MHGQAHGNEAVQAADRVVTRLRDLRSAGLGARESFLLLQTYCNGCVTHLLRANYEEGGWTTRMDNAIVTGVEDLLGCSLREDQTPRCFLKLAH